MGLTGVLKDGTTRVESIPLCQFEASGYGSNGEIGGCDEVASYRVIFATGDVLHACEEHAQRVWDMDEQPEPATLAERDNA